MKEFTYQSYHGLPSLAGVCSMAEAMEPGLSVDECVRRHKRYHYAFKRLHEIFTARLTAEPIYELKMGFSLHAHLCAEHTASIRKRVSEMREPPLGLEAVPDPNLEIFFDEILGVPTTEELVLGLYEKAVPALWAALERHLADTNHLADHPSVRVCRFALLELADVADFGKKTIECLVGAETRQRAADWLQLLDDCLAAAGELDGVSGKTEQHPSPGLSPKRRGETDRHEISSSSLRLDLCGQAIAAPLDKFYSRTKTISSPLEGEDKGEGSRSLARNTVGRSKTVVRQYSAKPYAYDRVPKRDERFPDPYNMGVNAETFLYNPEYPPQAKTLMMFYKRLREVDVPEMMASIITETKGKKWDYYANMTRQLWDEARHGMMGEVGFAFLGIDWPKKVMINHTWSLGLNTQLEPWQRHAVLYFIEQGLMPKTGKRFEWEVAVASHNPLSALFQDYDWADEVLHAQIGRTWYVSQFKNPQEAIRYGDECWSKVLMNWRSWRDQGLTRHRNWWPDLYQDACEKWGVKPDPKILAFSETYETTRADLKPMTGSA